MVMIFLETFWKVSWGTVAFPTYFGFFKLWDSFINKFRETYHTFDFFRDSVFVGFGLFRIELLEGVLERVILKVMLIFRGWWFFAVIFAFTITGWKLAFLVVVGFFARLFFRISKRIGDVLFVWFFFRSFGGQ